MSRVRVTLPRRVTRRRALAIRAGCSDCGPVGELSHHRPWAFDWTPNRPNLPAYLILWTGATVEALP